MSTKEYTSNLQLNLMRTIETMERPILIVSTNVGRGNYSIGEAITEFFSQKEKIYHKAVEEMLPHNAINEDLNRYKFISNNLTFLLHLIYRVPIFYFRKFLREIILKNTDLTMIKNEINKAGIKTVICISHRPAFWLSALKKREDTDFKCWGILTEFGRTLGWKYIFWDVMDGFFSPLKKEELDYNFHPKLHYVMTSLPVRRQFHEIAKSKGEINKVIIAAGFWGQVHNYRIKKLVRLLLDEFPAMQINMLCGTNIKLFNGLKSFFHMNQRVFIFGEMSDISPIMKECACVITKPGMSTILEVCAAKRTLFLIKGMPVAEDHNAEYAIRHLGAQWFSIESFSKWYKSPKDKTSVQF